MKKVTKYIALLIGGIALLSMAACSDDDGRTPSPAVDPNCIGASFVGDNIGYEELEDTDPKELTLTISRDKTEAAATVAIEVQANTENIFNIPQSVSFRFKSHWKLLPLIHIKETDMLVSLFNV